MNDDYHCWLDPIIEEQAKHYGLTTQQFSQLMNDAATEQERIEREGEDS
ncbi:hypothetical protein [Paraburkholderia sp. SIMBA_054]